MRFYTLREGAPKTKREARLRVENRKGEKCSAELEPGEHMIEDEEEQSSATGE